MSTRQRAAAPVSATARYAVRSAVLRRLTSPPVGPALVAVVLLLGTWLGLSRLSPHAVEPDRWQLSLPVVALLFAAGEVFVLHLHVRRQRRSVSLSEVPLVLGLFLATPWALVVGRLIGSALCLVLHRKQRGVKLVLNLIMFTAETTVALVVFRALLPDETTGIGAWVAAYVAAAVASCTSHVTVSVLIAMYERVLRLRELLRTSLSGVAAAGAVSTFGLLAANSLFEEPRSAVLLVGATGMLLVAYRAYASLSERHLALERLHQFDKVLAASPEVDEVLRSLLVQARELLRAEAAEVSFLPDGHGGRGLRVRLLRDGTLERTGVEDLAGVDPVSAEVVESGKSALLARSSGGSALRYLELRGQRAAVLVPLRGDVGVVGTLSVADRQSEAGTFDHADAVLLQTVADSAATALIKGRQLDELRQGALHDPLTGLPNRAQVLQVLQQMRGTDVPYAVFMLDLNGFKAVNDTCGHERGDALLKDVAVRLRSAVPDGALVGRLGGDEFAVVVPGITGIAEGEWLATRVVEAVQHSVEVDGVVLPVGTALGLCVAPAHGTDPAMLLRRADAAMYVGKRARAGATVWSAPFDELTPVVPGPRRQTADGRVSA